MRARDLDPYSPHMNNYVAGTLRVMRRFDEAVDQARKSLELNPSGIRARQILGMTYLDRSMFQEAIEEFRTIEEAEPDAADNVSTLGIAYAMAARREEATEQLKKLERMAVDHYVGPDHFAVVYLMLGEKEKAYELFSRAVDELCTAWVFGMGYTHIFDPYRSDERFQALLKRIGLKD